MKDIPNISDSEWEVMKVIWSANSCTANHVVELVSKTTEWKPNTIRTLINRLLKKGAIGYELSVSDGKTYNYYPLVSENECIEAESNSFIKKIFNGSLNVMLSNFIEERELSDNEIDELKQILEKRKGNGK